MQIPGQLDKWDGTLRLAWVAALGALCLALWVFQQGGSSWPTRLWGGLLAACAPVILAWPRLARAIGRPRLARRVAPRRWRGALDELDLLRRAGAI